MSGATGAADHRVEHDSMGPVEIESTRLWGPQTQRSLENFPIGRARYVWPRPVIRSLGLVKHAAASANLEAGTLDDGRARVILAAAAEVIAGDLDDHFPLVVFQTGSGTHTNMNVNEVIANRANQLTGRDLGTNDPIHPNDHVNRSQSSNDVFPTVMHLATVFELHDGLYPALETLDATLGRLRIAYQDVVKVGRTHLQDATPLTLGQEIGGWEAQLRHATSNLVLAEVGLRQLAIGGTATGTGLNAPVGFGARVTRHLNDALETEYSVTDDHFAATSSHDAMVNLSAALRTLAGALMKMANDIRWLASGPRNGIGELTIPKNEPGSSIMPGKTNPTQTEAITMVATQVFGNDATVAFAGSQGNFQLNVYKPVILHNVLDSIALLADSITAFERHCVAGIAPNRARIADNLASNLMIVTALAPHIGYDTAAAVARKAASEGLTIRDATIELGHATGEQYDEWIDPSAMTKPG